MKGKSRSPLYQRAFWKKRRKIQLAKKPLCEECWTILKRVRKASVADHVVPWNTPAEFHKGKLQSLCVSCHNLKTRTADFDTNRRKELTEIRDF